MTNVPGLRLPFNEPTADTDIKTLQKNASNAQNMIKELIKTYKQFYDEKDPANNCLDTAIITDPKLMTKQTKEKLKNIAGRVFKK